MGTNDSTDRLQRMISMPPTISTTLPKHLWTVCLLVLKPKCRKTPNYLVSNRETL